MLYGRDDERARIGELLDGARSSRSGVLVLRGEPGIGKTALLEDTLERATDMHVLSARGVESESELPFAGLHQLVRPALGDLDALPSPQQRALRGALGLGERTGDDRARLSALLTEATESPSNSATSLLGHPSTSRRTSTTRWRAGRSCIAATYARPMASRASTIASGPGSGDATRSAATA